MALTNDLVRSSALTRFRLAPNPGPMSLDGTNSYIIGAREPQVVASPGATEQVPTPQVPTPQGSSAQPLPTVVVDPGPLDTQHLEQLAAAGPVELILITHRHADHTEASEQFHRLTGAPVRALDPAYCHGGDPLTDGEVIEAAGVEIRVLATPGHTSDSVCFHLPADRPAGTDGTTGVKGQTGDAGRTEADGPGSVLTGDTILGRGTTILDYPDGRLGPYLESLQKLARLGHSTVLPAHGPVLPDLAEICGAYTEHRQQRLDQIRGALESLGADAAAEAVADLVYNDVAPSVRGAALKSVQAQLDYLRG
ncbi:MBL fold metallo-hydrolase [Arthrobacter monumenti]